MFTVRVQYPDLSHTLECAQYTVTRKTPPVLTLYPSEGPVQGQNPMLTVALEKGIRAFVMNDDGNTVDMLGERR